MNANVWMQHRENCQTVFQHRVFETSVRLEPLPMASVQTAAGSMPGGTGYVQPFDLTKCIASLGTENGMYLADINLAWLDLLQPNQQHSNGVVHRGVHQETLLQEANRLL